METIAFLDDHKLFTTTLSDFVKSKYPEVTITNFHDPNIFLESFEPSKFDLLILDLEMPNKSGIEVIRSVKSSHPDQKILVLSMFYNVQIAAELQQLGVQAFLPKNSDIEALEQAIQQVIEGRSLYEGSVSKEQIKKYKEQKTLLTRRELEIIKLSAQGMTSLQIAGELFISNDTVKTHFRNILSKTALGNFKEVIAHYQKEGWEVLA
ncbi:MAG: response regulator transcription factor [Reichenbachiella sp.]